MCEELKERFERFRRRDLYEIRLVALFLDATFIAVRPDGPKEGVQVAWGFTEDGERVLLAVSLGMRESFEDWQTLGRDLISRGLGAPMLIVADGAPGLIKAIEQCWPASDRQRCCVHRARNLYAKLPDRDRERVKHAYWQALDDAISETDAKRRLQALVDQLEWAASTRCALVAIVANCETRRSMAPLLLRLNVGSAPQPSSAGRGQFACVGCASSLGARVFALTTEQVERGRNPSGGTQHRLLLVSSVGRDMTRNRPCNAGGLRPTTAHDHCALHQPADRCRGWGARPVGARLLPADPAAGDRA